MSIINSKIFIALSQKRSQSSLQSISQQKMPKTPPPPWVKRKGIPAFKKPIQTSQKSREINESQTPTTTTTSKSKSKTKSKFATTAATTVRSLSFFPKPPSHYLESPTILTADFFQIDALDLAPRLLGKFLRRDEVVLQITEVEAYRPNDSACHGRFGITPRTAPVFGPGGHAYVYLCYGLHSMLNVVADKEGVGAAVLIRACAPISGLETIQRRRCQITEKPVLLTGPGKALFQAKYRHEMFRFQDDASVAQALGLSTEWSNHPLYTSGGLEVLDGPEPEKVLVGPRVGIEYASPEHVNALWRFAIAGSPWISAPKNTLRPP